MRLVVFGKSGQVARALARKRPDAIFLGRNEVDLRAPNAAAIAAAAQDAEAVVNAAAWTDVDGAEDNQPAAHAINADAPGAIARACAARDIPFVHISTDYVFDGSGDRPFRPHDATGPLGVYGATKRAGEMAVAAAEGRHAILRTSWVFSAQGRNFVRTMLGLSETRVSLRIVSDQIGGPTSAASIADAALAIVPALRAAPDLTGIYHFAGRPDVSWADFAREIFAIAGRQVSVEDIPSSEYPTPAARPKNSRLYCSSTMAAFGIDRPDWRNDLVPVVRELLGQE